MNAGKCDTCKQEGQLTEFVNDFAQPEIRFNLCQKCIRKAYTCLAIFLRTPPGRRAMVEKVARMNRQ